MRGTCHRIGILACVMGLGLSAGAWAQTPGVEGPQRIYTEADLDRIVPRWPNPYLSFLPADAEPDWAYWRAKLRLEGQRRAALRAAIPKAISIFDEGEPPDSRGWNDDQASAEIVAAFGTGDGALREIDVAGTLSAPPPRLLSAGQEDDGAIPLANETGLLPGERVRALAFIGDGPHGSLGSGSGDFDFYRLDALQPGQVVTIDIDTPEEASPRLDTKIGLYDSSGVLVDLNDNASLDSPDSFLEVTIAAAGTYYVIVRGINSTWPNDPFDSASGPKAGSEGEYTVTIGLDANDLDYYALDLQAGDVLGLVLDGAAGRLTLFDPDGTVRIGSELDGSFLYPAASPLPGGGIANAASVVSTTGRYAVAVERGEGGYTLALRAFRPVLEGQDTVQRLFLDFDGALYNAEAILGGNPVAELSPMVWFLDNMGLDPTPGGADENTVIDAILEVVAENLVDDLRAFGLNPDFNVEILNSRDHADPFGQPNVSRIIIGGTREELGLNTVGIAESVDVGNFATGETAVILLDLLTEPGNINSLHQIPLAPGTSAVDLLGLALGSIAAHEAGHLSANFHTGNPDGPSNIMDGSPVVAEFLGTGPDLTLGTADDVDVDFGPSFFNEREGFVGLQDTRNSIAFGLYGPPTPVAVEPASAVPATFELSAAYPNPFNPQTRFAVRVGRAGPVQVAVYDMLGRRVRLLFDGRLAAGGPHLFTLEAGDLPSGSYLIRATASGVSATQPVLLVK